MVADGETLVTDLLIVANGVTLVADFANDTAVVADGSTLVAVGTDVRRTVNSIGHGCRYERGGGLL